MLGLAGVFFDHAVAEGVEELHQFVDLGLEFATFVGVAHTHAPAAELHYLSGADNVGSIHDGVLSRRKGFVLNQLEASAVINKSIACNTCGVMIGFGETTIDYHEFAPGFDGRLTIGSAHGHMTVDDMTVLACDAERVKDHVSNIGTVAQLIIVSFFFAMSGTVSEEISLKGGHF